MILRPYVYEGSPPAAPSYAANFADYNAAAASPAQPQTAPYLAPGVPFIAPQNQVQFKNPPAVWPPNCDPAVASSAQGYDRQSFQDMCSREAEKHERRESKIKTDDPAVETKKELRSVPKETRDTANKEIISLLKETTEMLRGQLKAKDDQIKNLDDKIGQLIERNRETNILLKGLQDKIMLLEKPKTESHKDYHSEPARETEFSTPDSGASIDERQKNKKNSVPITVENDLPVSENDKQDTIQPSAPPIADKPVFSKEAKIEKIQKKGLFGKIFG